MTGCLVRLLFILCIIGAFMLHPLFGLIVLVFIAIVIFSALE